MLADNQAPKTIAALLNEEDDNLDLTEQDVLALAKPKPALSAFMYFAQERRAELSAEAANQGDVMKALGERWAATTDRRKYEALAASDKARAEREMAAYTAALEEEAAAERAARAAAASGPSERDMARAEKRALLHEQVEERAAQPKAPKKARTLTTEEKQLKEQNAAIEADKNQSAQDRLNFLLGQSDLFQHFGMIKDTSKPKGRKRKSEREEDEEMMGTLGDEAGGSGGGKKGGFEEKVRVTSQPKLINADHGSMRPYQIAGLSWLANLYQNGISGILADEMGLGKTLQSISLLVWLKEVKDLSGPFLVLAPKSTLTNWMREFSNWAPCFNTLLFHGDKDERAQMIAERMVPDGFDVCVTSYEMVVRESAAFRKFSWRYLIVDEAHRMKNEESKLSQVLRSFSSHSRLLITGTPMQNNLHELWALLNFLLPDIFTSSEEFNSWFDISDKQVEQEVISQLHKVLKPFLLRRVKTEVEGSIPPKTELIIYTHLSAMQKEQYKNILKRDMDALYQSSTKDLTANKSRLMNLVMQLRKCCNHPYLFEGVEDKTLDPFGEHLIDNCGKMRMLDRLLKRLKKEGSRVLIFSQMTRLLDILEDYCASRAAEGFSYCRIDGSTSGADRQDAIDAFNVKNSSKFLFLLSTRAGGLGINLQTADVVIIYDSDWNPQADLQAMDRAHRIGQTKEVKVFRFVTADSIEEKVVERAELKLQMDYAVIQQGRLADKTKALSKEEALAAVRYGADKVFKSENVEVTDEDLDVILQSAKNLTAEREEKLKDKEKRQLLDFSNAEVNFQEFDGIDYKEERELAKAGDLQFMRDMEMAVGKRERKEAGYSERAFRTSGDAVGSSGPKMPKQRRASENMKDFQLFNTARIIALEEAIHERECKHVKAVAKAADEGLGDIPEPELTDAEKKELAELEELKTQGFPDWTRSEFNKFVKAAEKFGRDSFLAISDEVATKTADEVREYAAGFWAKGAELVAEFDKLARRIEEGERKIAEKQRMAEALRDKVNSCDNPYQNLSIKYGNNKGKLYTDEEDRFLLCMCNELGYGKWEELKREVRRSPEFRFDWLFKSRTPAELGRRVDLLIRLIIGEKKGKGE